MEGKKMAFAGKVSGSGRASRLAKMAETNFEDETEIEDIISSNLSVAFPCLKMLKRQFTVKVPNKWDKGKHLQYRFDVLAFDNEKKCFVVIEYKNKKDSGLDNQVRKYKSAIIKCRTDFMTAHGDDMMRPDQYDWKASYMITISPWYSSEQLTVADNDIDQDENVIKMYEIKKFDDSIITLDRVNGSAVCNDTTDHSSPPTSMDSASNKNTILEIFDQMMHEVGYSERKELKRKRIAYKAPTGKNICIVIIQKERLKVHYGARKRDNILHEGSFVKYDENAPRKFGSGEYWSLIYDSNGVAQASESLKKIYKFLVASGRSGPAKSRPNHDKSHLSNDLHERFKSMIREIGELEPEAMAHYIAYRILNGRSVCTITEQANRLKLYYAAREHHHVLREDGFVIYDKNGRLHGGGDYKSFIHNYEDIERAMGPLKKVYDWRKSQS
ncbi:MAG: hypothetical protein MPJ05_07595 [Nitrosopumilus sp.]|nr:hypothetical protein [Nitrosopumilus sp.]